MTACVHIYDLQIPEKLNVTVARAMEPKLSVRFEYDTQVCPRAVTGVARYQGCAPEHTPPEH